MDLSVNFNVEQTVELVTCKKDHAYRVSLDFMVKIVKLTVLCIVKMVYAICKMERVLLVSYNILEMNVNFHVQLIVLIALAIGGRGYALLAKLGFMEISVICHVRCTVKTIHASCLMVHVLVSCNIMEMNVNFHVQPIVLITLATGRWEHVLLAKLGFMEISVICHVLCIVKTIHASCLMAHVLVSFNIMEMNVNFHVQPIVLIALAIGGRGHAQLANLGFMEISVICHVHRIVKTIHASC